MGTSLPSIAVVLSLAAADPTPATETLPPHPSALAPQLCAGNDVHDPDRGQTLFNAGLGLTISGLAIGVLIGGPALLLRRNARQDAARATYEARQRRYARRADRREVVAFSAIGAGGIMMLIGIPLMVAGSRSKNESRAAVAPVITPNMAGVNARLRF